VIELNNHRRRGTIVGCARVRSDLRLEAARHAAKRPSNSMITEDKVLKVADQLAHVSQRKIIDLGKNIADLKFKLKKKTGEQATEIKKSKRRRTFSASENGTTRCPWCWILDGNNGSLEPVGNNRILRCPTCNHSLFVG
jgi:hypothetical protein